MVDGNYAKRDHYDACEISNKALSWYIGTGIVLTYARNYGEDVERVATSRSICHMVDVIFEVIIEMVMNR